MCAGGSVLPSVYSLAVCERYRTQYSAAILKDYAAGGGIARADACQRGGKCNAVTRRASACGRGCQADAQHGFCDAEIRCYIGGIVDLRGRDRSLHGVIADSGGNGDTVIAVRRSLCFVCIGHCSAACAARQYGIRRFAVGDVCAGKRQRQVKFIHGDLYGIAVTRAGRVRRIVAQILTVVAGIHRQRGVKCRPGQAVRAGFPALTGHGIPVVVHCGSSKCQRIPRAGSVRRCDTANVGNIDYRYPNHCAVRNRCLCAAYTWVCVGYNAVIIGGADGACIRRIACRYRTGNRRVVKGIHVGVLALIPLIGKGSSIINMRC